ncbi:CRISPR-associated endonuclease Cas1 [Anabaena sp. UHCC 0399]|uniref:CRISPR-associated endonuclease Cas1 n=1 Tax=Anabaena sp. UHCC 0399 TaxID=3110238 RepID=UPI002B1F325C|nr:CRISPR-associated endonuclease Cas1 [Anabaena sp. UHCC 0399]MEA5568614.1 CRISPR-associated endonuclease Cas1 [Anabaena sp. UHCC 0399]
MSTIYITEQDVSFQIQHQYLKVFHQQNQRISIPIRNLSQFIIFGNIRLPKEVIKLVTSHQIPVLYLTQTGEYLGRLENPSQLQAKYLTYQRRRARDIEFNRATAESIIWAKLHNQHTVLQNWTRHYANHTTQRALNYLMLLMDNLPVASGIDQLHEYSQEADNIYYCAVASLISFYNQCPPITAKRISGLINLGNQLLHQYIYTLLNTVGLDPNYPILHRDIHQELPLAWDFTAEFRAPIVDDLVLNFVRNSTNTNGNGNGNGKSHSQKLLQKFLQHWEGKLRTFVLHPYAGEVSYRQCLDLQVREYLASLLGDVEFYRPLALKFHPANSDFINTIKPPTIPLKLVKR